MNITDLLMSILFILILIGWLLALNNKRLPVWFCKHMGWHLRPKQVGFDGCSLTGICPRCGEHVMQDSQGNWF